MVGRGPRNCLEGGLWRNLKGLLDFLDGLLSLIIMGIMITTVTGKNQITIPARLAERLGIRPGQRIDWSIGDDDVLIARLLPGRGELARRAAGMGKEWLDEDVDPIADLIRDRISADREEGLA